MSKSVLDLPTLVLNRQWQPVHVTTVARSLILLWNDTVRVVDPDDYRLFAWNDWAERRPAEGELCIRSARLRLAVPEIIALAHYERLPGTAVTFSRRNVAKGDHYTCQYCGIQPGAESITIDHVLPRSQGGASTWINCVAACVGCNTRKGDRTPDQAGMRLRRRPPSRVEAVLRSASRPRGKLVPIPDTRAGAGHGLTQRRSLTGVILSPSERDGPAARPSEGRGPGSTPGEGTWFAPMAPRECVGRTAVF